MVYSLLHRGRTGTSQSDLDLLSLMSSEQPSPRHPLPPWGVKPTVFSHEAGTSAGTWALSTPGLADNGNPTDIGAETAGVPPSEALIVFDVQRLLFDLRKP